MKRCGLYIRVSTERQAKAEEGLLKVQNELLTRHIEVKNALHQRDEWVMVDRYVDEGIAGDRGIAGDSILECE